MYNYISIFQINFSCLTPIQGWLVAEEATQNKICCRSLQCRIQISHISNKQRLCNLTTQKSSQIINRNNRDAEENEAKKVNIIWNVFTL